MAKPARGNRTKKKLKNRATGKRCVLKRAGYHVLEAGRVQEARELTAESSPDVMVVDGLLPDGTGLDFIAEVRTYNLHTEIIFLSAFFRDFKTFHELRGHLQVGEVLHK